jgi:hypothetical protein
MVRRTSRVPLLLLLAMAPLTSRAYLSGHSLTSRGKLRQPEHLRHRQQDPLNVAKSGGRLIETEHQYLEIVLSKDIPRPVLVFFSAPWYVGRYALARERFMP